MDADRIGREGLTRRPSFRKSLAEAGLPEEYLEKLEQKRRQLDDSIHKYIAAKEREYKQYEKDLRQQRRLSLKEQGSGAAEELGQAPQRRALLEGAPALTESLKDGREGGLVGRELRGSADSQVIVEEEGHNHDTNSDVQPRTNGNGNGESRHHNKELNGLFTPPFLTALEDGAKNKLERSASAPIAYPPAVDGKLDGLDLQRANSDTYAQARLKRPVHLQLAHRTSSSGSSADGKLVSAMKSSASSTRNRNRRKRVSLAVGDVIVAPADNVPVPVNNNNRRASHSRLRSSTSDRGRQVEETAPAEEPQVLAPLAPLAASPTVHRPSQAALGGSLLSSGLTAQTDDPTSPDQQENGAQVSSPLKGDIGDMWHLEDSDDGQSAHHDPESDADGDDALSRDIDDRNGVGARYSSQRDDDDDEDDDSNNNTTEEVTDPEADIEEHDSAVHLEFRPGSVKASQHPTSPGFRRPSVSADPEFQGANYGTAAYHADANGVYGSKYVTPGSKGSFTAGSLGESYMARNAEFLAQFRQSRQRP